MSVPTDVPKVAQIASSTMLDAQDLLVLADLVRDAIDEALRWSQRAVALSALETKLRDVATGQTRFDDGD